VCPEINHEFCGENEARLRGIFEKASLKAPGVIFIDEIETIAPNRAEVLGEMQKISACLVLCNYEHLPKKRLTRYKRICINQQ
jgi:SpoVK/Ycf46/Vps4 family AAA+-type ATPase